MQLIRGLQRWKYSDPCVLTIGNFDGVHCGHQAIFKEVCQTARSTDLPAVVVSFEPLPHEYFDTDNLTQRLQGLRDRVNSIADAGIDRLLLLDFNEALAAMPANDFLQRVLVEKLQVRHMVIGDDFRFGRGRSGSFNTLREAAGAANYTLVQSPTCTVDGERVSSSRIRQYLKSGQITQAERLLGRPYRISGRVIHGEKLGRQLGFPTANIALKSHCPPLRGVFAVTANLNQTQQQHAAVANLGERPTIGGRKLLLEVHVLDAKPDLYGRHLSIDFHQQIRPEKRFDSLEALQAQIALDCDTARALLT